eukprot:6284070-Prymnesium_polylepis.1
MIPLGPRVAAYSRTAVSRPCPWRLGRTEASGSAQWPPDGPPSTEPHRAPSGGPHLRFGSCSCSSSQYITKKTNRQSVGRRLGATPLSGAQNLRFASKFAVHGSTGYRYTDVPVDSHAPQLDCAPTPMTNSPFS